MKKFIYLALILIVSISCNTKAKKVFPSQAEVLVEESVETVPNIFVVKTTFPSKDGLLITADIYEVNGVKPTILLCHQAGFSRGEYKDTALKLNELGYSCMAIDQRSGKIANEVKNETVQRAIDKGLPTSYMDAKQDIEAAIDYMYNENSNQPILLVGSSYSASLVLLIGKDNPKIKAVASFSPGEYLKGVNLTQSVKDFPKSVFVTSSKNEISQIEGLDIKVMNGALTHFKPTSEGIHGSRALWKSTIGNEKYWEAFEGFLGIVNGEIK